VKDPREAIFLFIDIVVPQGEGPEGSLPTLQSSLDQEEGIGQQVTKQHDEKGPAAEATGPLLSIGFAAA
jgi:hypothetical protein